MLLSQVAGALAEAGIEHERRGDAELTAVVHRTDALVPGALFCCIPGHRVDGHDLAAVAVAAGARALLVERDVDVDVPQLRVPSARAAIGPVAARFWGDPSRALTVVGVTGTNGKTTTVSLLRSILEVAGRRCEALGTLTSGPGGPPTTPDAPDLQARLAAWRDDGVEVVAMEVSSHALAMHRVDGTWFEATAFTTLGHDHLDVHGDLGSYFEAKASLFRPERTRRAVVRADDEWGARLIERLAGGDVEVRPFRLADAEDLTLVAHGSRFRLRGAPVELPLHGRHNVANAVCAAAVADWLGVDPATVAAGLSATPTVAGRFELVDEGQPFTVAVDYAHTPDALQAVLDAAREQADSAGGRVVVVFGCGGDKDRAKRPEMGRIAAASADVVVVTSDNPRSEDPQAIIDEVLAGVPAAPGADVRRVVDRAEAIHHATREARDHDVVVIAGKGHEATQVLADREVPFDDRLVAAEALRTRREQRP
jgi:UDP-N-acetylmuramoyl-L-alanyl-D-glutamate--2,6-diaminopimelate ligase